MTFSRESQFLPSTLPENVLDIGSFDLDRLDFEGFICKTEAQHEFSREIASQGLHLMGWYDAGKPSDFDPDGEGKLPVISFKYFKGGQAEVDERLVIWDGEGFGVLDSHHGQDPANYIMGLQIGVFDHGYRYVVTDLIGRRNFSKDCIMGGDRGDDPVDALSSNPSS